MHMIGDFWTLPPDCHLYAISVLFGLVEQLATSVGFAGGKEFLMLYSSSAYSRIPPY